jgi:hypothetical protein
MGSGFISEPAPRQSHNRPQAAGRRAKAAWPTENATGSFKHDKPPGILMPFLTTGMTRSGCKADASSAAIKTPSAEQPLCKRFSGPLPAFKKRLAGNICVGHATDVLRFHQNLGSKTT